MPADQTTNTPHTSSNVPSIFNDSVGTVMRGPSSSHCAAAHRIGRLCRDLLNGKITSLVNEYDTNGALVSTHKGQGPIWGCMAVFLTKKLMTTDCSISIKVSLRLVFE